MFKEIKVEDYKGEYVFIEGEDNCTAVTDVDWEDLPTDEQGRLWAWSAEPELPSYSATDGFLQFCNDELFEDAYSQFSKETKNLFKEADKRIADEMPTAYYKRNIKVIFPPKDEAGNDA